MSERRVRVAIVGGGPAGIGVALRLSRMVGIGSVAIVERRGVLGGIPARYHDKPGGVPTFILSPVGPVVFGAEYARRLRAKLARTDTQVFVETQVVAIDADEKCLTVVGPELGKCVVRADAIVLACGAREPNAAERGVLAGYRPARVFYSSNIIDWLDGHDVLPATRPVLLGSDVLAHAAAAKLKAAGAQVPEMLDGRARPESSRWERLYFRRWVRPSWHGGAEPVEIRGYPAAVAVGTADGEQVAGDGVVLCGGLVPNSELAVAAGLAMREGSREPVVGANGALSRPGVFAAGNVRGGFLGARECHAQGHKLAASVAAYLGL